jgi:hypothetical protein
LLSMLLHYEANASDGSSCQSRCLCFLINDPIYARMARLEPWWSGLTYLFAKEADLLKGLEGSNPSGSATCCTRWFSLA